MTAARSLAAWGILRADEVVELAAGAGLELAVAATMLEKESSGGHNVWGRDGVPTGGFYTKGGPVTRANYLAWKPHRGRLGSQGVGPTQLTYPPLQDRADALGGCWDWRCNVHVGFEHLASLVRRYGLEAGFRAYNGGDKAARAGVVPDADRYGRDAMARLAKWRDRLGTTPSPAARTDTPTTAPQPTTEGDVSVQNILLDGAGEITLRLPVGHGAIASSRAWISANLRSGATRPGRVRWWFQGVTAGISRRDWTSLVVVDGLSSEVTDELPPGTRKINIQYEMPDGGVVCLEAIR